MSLGAGRQGEPARSPGEPAFLLSRFWLGLVSLAWPGLLLALFLPLGIRKVLSLEGCGDSASYPIFFRAEPGP